MLASSWDVGIFKGGVAGDNRTLAGLGVGDSVSHFLAMNSCTFPPATQNVTSERTPTNDATGWLPIATA